MAGWVRLSIQCMQYEYPHWHICLAFAVFDLGATKKGRPHGFGAEFQAKSFERLGVAFDGNAEVLRKQFDDHVGFATAMYKQKPDAGAAHAWASSIKRSHGMRLPPDAIFRKCIHALQAWDGFTSSEIERGFSAARRLLGCHRQCIDSDMQSIILGLVDLPAGELNEIISDAQCIWNQHWQNARPSGPSSRCNFSRKREKHQALGPLTETEFIKKRRASVESGQSEQGGDGVMTRDAVLDAAKEASAAQWGDEQQKKEDQYLSLQLKSKAFAAIGDNVLLPSERDGYAVEVARDVAA